MHSPIGKVAPGRATGRVLREERNRQLGRARRDLNGDLGRVAIQASTLQQSCEVPLPIGALGINARNLAARAGQSGTRSLVGAMECSGAMPPPCDRGRSRSVPIRRITAPAPIYLAWGSSWAISPNSAICCPRASPVEALTTPRLSITDPARTNSRWNSGLDLIVSSVDRSA